jgi:putative ABC transport system permease protein
VDEFLETEIEPYAEVYTKRQLLAKLDRVSRSFHLIFGVVDIFVAVAIALVMGMINQIAISRRLSEFGVLNALGISKNKLTRRLMMETAVVSIWGWLLGLGASWGFFNLLRITLYEPYGVQFRWPRSLSQSGIYGVHLDVLTPWPSSRGANSAKKAIAPNTSSAK